MAILLLVTNQCVKILNELDSFSVSRREINLFGDTLTV
jgi:hypothetical protein